MLETVSRIHKTYLVDQQLFCWRHYSKIEVVQNTDLNILALYLIIDYIFNCQAIMMEVLVVLILSEDGTPTALIVNAR